MKKAIKFTTIFFLITAWIFSGFPRLWNFPSKIKEAQAAISEVSASANTTLSATTYTLVNSMTLTPGAGDYLAVFTMETLYNATAADNFLRVSIYVNGVQQAHTERELLAEGSLDATVIPISTHANITVGVSQAIEVRYLITGTSAFTGRDRTLTLFPTASLQVNQATDTVDDTLDSGTDTLIDNMILTPGAGDYLAVFSTSADGPSAAQLAFSLYVNGSQLAHTERTNDQEGSIPATEFSYLIAAKISPTAGQVVEARWRRSAGTGTITTHERTLTLVKVDTNDIFEVSATADTTVTNTTDALMNSLTLTPGAGDYLAIFSSSQRYGTISANESGFYSFYVNSAQITASERQVMQEGSVDNADQPSFTAGKISPTAGQVVEVQWRGGSTTSRIGHERTLVLLKEAAANPTFTLNDYRWYVDNNGENVTDPWGVPDIAENTAITILPAGSDPPGPTQELRLRVNFTVNTANLSATSQQFELQYKAGTDASCTSGSWTDVGAGGGAEIWRFATSGVTDGTDLTALKLAASDVLEEYVKVNPSATNHNSATTTQDIEYDFHIEHNAATDATQYSFRVRESDDTVFDAYTTCPTLTTEPGTANLMRHGNLFSEGIEQGFFWAD